VWTGMVETELFAQTYKSYGLAPSTSRRAEVRRRLLNQQPSTFLPVTAACRVEVERRRKPFENGRGFSLRVLRA
jgi:hypothetical protein